MKQRLNRIPANTFRQEKGELIISDGYELYKVPTRLERLEAERERLENQLKEMKEPTQEELIQEGKMFHPFFDNQMQLKMVEEQIKKLSDADNL